MWIHILCKDEVKKVLNMIAQTIAAPWSEYNVKQVFAKVTLSTLLIILILITTTSLFTLIKRLINIVFTAAILQQRSLGNVRQYTQQAC